MYQLDLMKELMYETSLHNMEQLYEKMVDILADFAHNICTKREISSWQQDMKHKAFASVVLAT